MSASSVAIKGVKTGGSYSLKGFEKDGKFIGKNAVNLLGNVLKSKPVKTVAGIGMTIGSLYLFGPSIITAKVFKELVIDNCILDKKKSVMDSVRDTVEANKDTLQKAVVNPALENDARHTEDKIFDKGGER